MGNANIGQTVRVELSDKTVLRGRLTYSDDDLVEISSPNEPGTRQRHLILKTDVISIKRD
jgi:small nuclear ribonucleoprotein (snRNP)-like protein